MKFKRNIILFNSVDKFQWNWKITNFNKIFKISWLFDLSFKFYTTALIIAVENKNVEIVRLLLENPNIDVNILNYEIYN